jgi:hypothetical protein
MRFVASPDLRPRRQPNADHQPRVMIAHPGADRGRLYRFIDWVVGSRQYMLAVVEDCGSLEILIVGAEQLNAWREVGSAPR